MEKTCDNCYYADYSGDKEPCCSCKRTLIIKSDMYDIAPDLWRSGDDNITVSDNVEHPTHYNREDAMECIDEMIAVFGIETVMDFCLCNVWKYRYRAAEKNGVEDLYKSDWYMRKYIELKEKNR